MLGPDNVEGGIRKRQIQRIALTELDGAFKPDQLCQYFGGIYVLGGKIDADHPAPLLAGQVPGGAADTATDVEDPQAGDQPAAAGKLDGCLAAANMEGIDGRKISRGQPGRARRRRGKRGEDGRQQLAAAVMVLDVAGFHFVPLLS